MNHLRSEFLLDPEVVFLNHGSFGACPLPVFQAYQRWQRELEREPVEFLGRRFDELLANARRPLARYVNCAADDLVYVPNATQGLNIVARSLSLQPGDEILTTDHEYGALNRTWTFLTEKAGAKYVRVPIPLPITTADDFIGHVWSAVTPRTRVLFLSHITSPTALVFPIQELCHRARGAGILTVIDGAHAVGQIPLNLTELGADFYSSNCHKWLLSPKGSAFLYARREVQPLVEPLVISWGWRPELPAQSKFIQEQEWQGTRDIAPYLSVPAAIEFVQAHNWDTVRAECHALAQYARNKFAALTGLPPLSPDANGDAHVWYSQMVSIPLPPCDLKQLKQRLYDEYKIQVPVLLWQSADGLSDLYRHLLRVSVQCYNTRTDIDALVHALEQLLPLVQM